MKSNRTYQHPPEPIENLGDGTFYYNFNIVKTEETDLDGNMYLNYEYDQVRCSYPINESKIQQKLDEEGYSHEVNLGKK